jgi:hypothetical protein
VQFPPPPLFSEHTSTNDNTRLDASNPAIPSGVTSFLDSRDLQQDATACDHLRSPSATKNATRALPDDPDLAAVVTAWPSLPEAIRAGILAMVRASAPDQGPGDRSPD